MNGQKSAAQFENAFNNERNRYAAAVATGTELAAKRRLHESLRQQVLNRLIDEALLGSIFPATEISSISDEQVKQAIFATRFHRWTVKFDNNRYNAIVNQMGMTADQYAQALRTSLPLSN